MSQNYSIVDAVYYRPTPRHIWCLIGMNNANLDIEDLRAIAEEAARTDDQNKGTYEIALMSGIDEEAAWCFNLAPSLPGWKTLR